MNSQTYREIPELKGRLFAIGDIHGCLTELRCMLDHLISKRELSADDVIIFIGDYIDRGPSARGVVDFLLELRGNYPNTFFLKGNHEDMLLGFLGLGGEQGPVFLLNGGTETAASYGVKGAVTRDMLLEQMPEQHLEFYRTLDRYLITPKHVFAHAGLNPLRDLLSQVDSDLFWIRDEFIQNVHHFEKVVVFGHTPFQEIMVHLPYKVGIDTGCVFGNALSCLELTEMVAYQVATGTRKVKRAKVRLRA